MLALVFSIRMVIFFADRAGQCEVWTLLLTVVLHIFTQNSETASLSAFLEKEIATCQMSYRLLVLVNLSAVLVSATKRQLLQLLKHKPVDVPKLYRKLVFALFWTVFVAPLCPRLKTVSTEKRVAPIALLWVLNNVYTYRADEKVQVIFEFLQAIRSLTFRDDNGVWVDHRVMVVIGLSVLNWFVAKSLRILHVKLIYLRGLFLFFYKTAGIWLCENHLLRGDLNFNLFFLKTSNDGITLLDLFHTLIRFLLLIVLIQSVHLKLFLRNDFILVQHL